MIELGDSRAYPITPDNYLVDSTGKAPDSADIIKYCNILLQRNNVLDHTNEYVLGTIFMFNYYIVFDFENQQIGFNGRTLNLSKDDPTDPAS